MTFSAARCALGAIPRRGLRSGVAVPTIVGVTSGNTFGNQIITPPAGSVGDLIFVHLTRRNKGGSPEFEQVGGETFAELWNVSDVGISSSGHAGYWRIRTGSDTTYDFNEPGGDWAGHVCYAISGHDPTTPIIDWSMKFDGDGTSYIVPAVSGDITNCLLLQLGGAGGGLTGSLTAPTPNDGVDHASHRFGSVNGAIHAAVHENFTVGGGSGTRTWGIGHSSETRFGAQIMIAPIEGGPFYLEQEGSADHILFEDDSGALVLE